MKYIHFLDLSGSYIHSPNFKQAVKEIYNFMSRHQHCNHEIIVYGFGKVCRQLTEDDIRELYHMATKGTSKSAIELQVFKQFGFGSKVQPIVSQLCKIGNANAILSVAKVTIHSDFEFDITE